MKLGLRTTPPSTINSSITASPTPCAIPPSTCPTTCSRVQHLADVLRGRQVHDAHQAQLGVDVDHGSVRRARERHVGVALAVGVSGYVT